MNPREATPRPKGTVVHLKDGRLQIRIRLADGTRIRSKIFPKGTSEAEIRRLAVEFQEKHKGKTAADLGRRSTAKQPKVDPAGVDAWIDNWYQDRVRRGLTSAKDSLAHWKHHIAEVFERKHPRAWVKQDFRNLSAALDTKVQTDQISWKTARCIYGTAAKMADDACNAKLQSIRIRDDDPSIGVRPPDRGVSKAKTFIYPSEFLALVGNDKVPQHWRRRIACAVYLGLRAGEQDALEWQDIDLARGIIDVRRAIDRSQDDATKGTKTGQSRFFPIEPTLLPLLTAMQKEAGGKGAMRVFEELDSSSYSPRLRTFLRRSGATRASLYLSDKTAKPLGWHDLRSSFATWMAVRGDGPLTIQERLGHTDFATTQIYIRTAQQLGATFGEVFPTLPVCLLGPSLDHPSSKLAGFMGFLASPTRFELVLQP